MGVLIKWLIKLLTRQNEWMNVLFPFGQLYDYLRASEATQRDMGKVEWYQTTAEHSNGWTWAYFVGYIFHLP